MISQRVAKSIRRVFAFRVAFLAMQVERRVTLCVCVCASLCVCIVDSTFVPERDLRHSPSLRMDIISIYRIPVYQNTYKLLIYTVHPVPSLTSPCVLPTLQPYQTWLQFRCNVVLYAVLLTVPSVVLAATIPPGPSSYAPLVRSGQWCTSKPCTAKMGDEHENPLTSSNPLLHISIP
jgi:hypothetical protein